MAEVLQETSPERLYGATYRSVATGAHRAGTTDINTALDELWGICLARAGVEASRAQKRADREEANRRRREELQQRDLGPPEQGGMLPAICVHGTTYYVLNATELNEDDAVVPKYFPATNNAAMLGNLLSKGCESLDLRLHTHTGSIRPTGELLMDYGHQVERVTLMLYGTTPYIEGKTLFIPAVSHKTTTARYHEDVHAWLKLLGGGHHEALLDWLATSTNLSRPTSAVYLEGPPGTGKTLLAIGLAALWGEAPISFNEALSRFNSGLSRCPVVLLDEGVHPRRGEEAAVSARFRSLVADTDRRLEAKGRPTMSLAGSVRVMIAANNSSALPLLGNHTGEDIRAVVSRIRHFKVDPRAKDLLGWEKTDGWVRDARNRPGKIAEHVLWLSQNRSVELGERFLVPGVLTDFHDGLALTDIRLSVLTTVVEAVALGAEAAAEHGVELARFESVNPENGWLPPKRPPDDTRLVLVRTRGLLSAWPRLTREYRTPTQARVAGALGALRGVTKSRLRGKGKDYRYYVLPHHFLFRAAEKATDIPESRLRAVLGYLVSSEDMEETGEQRAEDQIPEKIAFRIAR